MIEALWVLRDRIAAVDSADPLSCWVGRAPEDTPMPYVTLSAPGWDTPGEAAVCGPGMHYAGDARVKVVDTTESNVHVRLAEIRDSLTPSRSRTTLDLPGRYTTLEFTRSEFVGSDPDVTYGATDQKAGVGVDTYHIDSQPTI